MRRCWNRLLMVTVLTLLVPLCAYANGRKSPENPTIVLGLIGGIGLTWKYVRARYGK
jgi:hypothetical protein